MGKPSGTRGTQGRGVALRRVPFFCTGRVLLLLSILRRRRLFLQNLKNLEEIFSWCPPPPISFPPKFPPRISNSSTFQMEEIFFFGGKNFPPKFWRKFWRKISLKISSQIFLQIFPPYFPPYGGIFGGKFWMKNKILQHFPPNFPPNGGNIGGNVG